MEEKVLFCDIDDVIIESATRIQRYVEDNTMFNTDVLKALEQFKRNCQYYYDCIVEEYKNAYMEGRVPNLKRFPNMGMYDSNMLSKEDGKGYYRYPILSAESYLVLANKMLDEYLEERDMFLELDNLRYGEKKNYNFNQEKAFLAAFKISLYNGFEALEQINKFCLSEVNRISSEAKEKGALPDYKALVKMDTNDIIRTNEKLDSYEERFYHKPCEDVQKCCDAHLVEYAIKNFARKESMSREIVDYNRIYTVENVNKDAIISIKKLMLSGKVDRLCFITHHNGEREEVAKRRLISILFPEADFLGMRFHSEEHNLKRRFRSSKFDKAQECYQMNPNNMILLDDSKDNCDDWYKKTGKVIIYRRITDAEKIGKMAEFNYPRIANFNFLEEAVDSVLDKEKTKRLERK